MFAPLEGMFQALFELVLGFVLVAFLSVAGGVAVAQGLRMRGLRWTWSALLLLPVLLLSFWSLAFSLAGTGICVVGCLAGIMYHSSDLMAGGDHAEIVRSRLGVLQAAQRAFAAWRASRRRPGWLHDGCLEIGRDERGQPVWIPAGSTSGSHALLTVCV